VNFAARFVSPEGRRELTGDRGWLETGPVRVAGIVELDIAGHQVDAALREYRRLPSLRSIRFDLPGVRLVLHGWDLTFDELERHARGLERLELGTELFRSMEAAQARTTRRFDELHGHGHDPRRTRWATADEPNER
jgi:hypothetical protein